MNLRCIRCVVNSWDGNHIYASSANGPLCIDLTDAALPDLLAVGMQINLLDCCETDGTLVPELIVLEPRFLVDVSAIAACFQDYGHHPFYYLYQRLRPQANTQQILLGNFAGTALDNTIHQHGSLLADTLRQNFREQALQFCTCPDFDPQRFKTDAEVQMTNIGEAVDVLFHDYDRSKALLEPSFVCEILGLQGRVDLMTSDMQLLVEQKSGTKLHQLSHRVQLLLYYGILHYNFDLPADHADIRLLYSKFHVRYGLLPVDFDRQLFREAINLRNRIVAMEVAIARHGFGTMMPQLRSSILLENKEHADFFDRFIRPETDRIFQPLHQLPPVERDYIERMLTFVYREQLAQKLGVQEAQDVMTGLLLRRSHDDITLRIDASAEALDFRRGDMVYIYHYEGTPGLRANILYKGVIAALTSHEVTVRLNDSQQNPALFTDGTYAIEHGTTDIGTTAAIRSLHAFCRASQDKRALLLGQRAPRRDTTLQCSRSYHPHYDDIILRARQAQDYFLLQGPPGTGKTSRALRYLVQEEPGAILLTAYTNRAVDEICDMLEDAGLDYLRIGSEASCDPRFIPHLISHTLGERPKLSTLRQQLLNTHIMVGTTSTLQARPYILQAKCFSLCIVDEASQILEPNIIGLLAADSIRRFILIGDHKQLPAVVQQPDDEPRLHGCRLSLFERLLQQEHKAGRKEFIGLLNHQGRMHPDIAAFPNEMFYAQEQLMPVPCPHQTEQQIDYSQPSEDTLDELLKQHRVLFVNSEDKEHPETGDKVNVKEACIVADLLRRIYRQYGNRFDADTTVGVIVPYRNQIAMIRREIARLGMAPLQDISIDTVERYQGSQRDVIIYSFTVHEPSQLDFLTSTCFQEGRHTIDRKLNVAMTRARKQLLMTGHATILRQNAIFAELIRRYVQKID